MEQFDDFLRQGLMSANLAQYENAIRKVEAADLNASPQYCRERTRLLADPWNWAKRQSGRKRLDWRLIAIAAALLLLSACAYAVATGQFSQWFPTLRVDSKAPETSEDVLSRTGTVVGQSQTLADVTATLNAAVWDGENLYLSLVVESPNIPEEVQANTQLYMEECTLKLRDDQWQEYTRKDIELEYAEMGLPLDDMENTIQIMLDRGQTENFLYPVLVSREGDILTFEILWELRSLLEQPELTLHLENIATYEDGKGEGVVLWDGGRTGPGPKDVILEDSMDFTFTLDEPLYPIRYGSDMELTLREIPFHITEFKVSVSALDVSFEVPAEANLVWFDPGNPDPGAPTDTDATNAVTEALLGLWMEDGSYLELDEMSGSAGIVADQEGVFSGFASCAFPHVVDPALAAAVNIGGVRVELSELVVLTE